ncbi:MAG TPA: hypothetical protein VF347_04155 [Candidatus Humimicrobiaceae bacterium]
MFESAVKFAIASIIEKHKNRDLSPFQLKKELFLRLYGNDFTEIQKAEILKSIDNALAATMIFYYPNFSSPAKSPFKSL